MDGEVAAVLANHACRASDGFFAATALARRSQVDQAQLVAGGMYVMSSLLRFATHTPLLCCLGNTTLLRLPRSLLGSIPIVS